MDDVRNVLDAFGSFDGQWQPHRLTSINDYDLKIARVQGEFVWHSHPDTDELFVVIEGELTIQLRDRDVVLGPYDVFVVPRGVEHCPRSTAETKILMVEPTGTVNTGDRPGERTAALAELS